MYAVITENILSMLAYCVRFSTCCGAVEYRAVWAEPESFDEILVGARMISDHLPDTVQKALDSAARSGDVLTPPQPQTEYIV